MPPFLTEALIGVLILSSVGSYAQSDKVVAANPPPSHTRIGQWSLTVKRDVFAGRASCIVKTGRKSYERKALVLQLPSNIDTSDARYRIDWGAPTSVIADRTVIASLGFAVWRDTLPNPSGGIVRIPYAKLSGAHAVQVEASPGGRVWGFSLDGLAAAVGAAEAAGCA